MIVGDRVAVGIGRRLPLKCEVGAIGSTPAVINAVLDALLPLGVADIAMPATPHRVWQAIHAAKPAKAAE